ncbi:MAG TPA: tRNA (adenosine(37)-N6)-dimethylallyltransferase MiaA [Firmicutes bacterium]|mgnify:FL=1|nr:tRNA (adenosine(37)-N6)-dimethylallyltransferase MiaA [Bacillota bacterium]
MKPPLLIIAGPTASGKTAAAVETAKRLNGAIISADSMQVYRGMDIGTATPTLQEREGIAHYFLDEWAPDEPGNAMRFQARAKAAIQEIQQQGMLPILAGGTGFYIQALLYDNEFVPVTDQMRQAERQVAQLYAEQGEAGLFEALRQVDADYAAMVHPHNVKRVMRALCYYLETGEQMSHHNAMARQKPSPYDYLFVVLDMDREVLYHRIDSRVDQMMASGLLEEVERLVAAGYDPSFPSMQGLGYKEMIPVLNGECTAEAAAEELKKRTRHFAKRQLTWFRRQKDAIWLPVTGKTATDVAEDIVSLWQNR